MKISVCGKGGSGKSTLVTLLAQQALTRNFRVLVVDSDESNSGLFRMLGFKNPPVPLMDLVGGKKNLRKKMGEPNVFVRSEFPLKDIPSPYIQSMDGLMLVSIGKILQSLEGCACPMGVLSREFLKKLHLEKTDMALIDMEAGVEHFGRGIDEAIDKVLVVVEPSFESLTVAAKIKSLAAAMNKEVVAVLNKMPSEKVAQKLEEELSRANIQIIGSIPSDSLVFDACLEGRVIDQGKAFHAAGKTLDALLAVPSVENAAASAPRPA